MRNNVDSELRIKVRKYLEYLHSGDGTREVDKEAILLGRLSNSLREEVLIQIYGHILGKFPFFRKNFSPEMLEKASKIMKTIRFAPGDTIFQVKQK